MCLFRINARRLMAALHTELGIAHYIMVAGSGEPARRLGTALENSAESGIRLLGFLDDEPGQVLCR